MFERWHNLANAGTRHGPKFYLRMLENVSRIICMLKLSLIEARIGKVTRGRSKNSATEISARKHR